MDEYVLDSFAVFAYLQNEAGGSRVERLLQAAARREVICRLSVINAGEVVYGIDRRGGIEAVRQFLVLLGESAILVEPATWERVLAAARVKARYRLSYADAFAAGLAQELGGTIVTGDPEFHLVADLVNVEWLPE